MNFLLSKDADPTTGAISSWRLAISVVGLALLITLLAAVTAVGLVRFVLPNLPATWSEVILHRGAGKIMERSMQVWLVLFLPFLLRGSGWRGWRDCGWQGAASAPPIWKDILSGNVVGLTTLGGLTLFMVLTGRRVACALETGTSIPLDLLWFMLSAAVVAVFEETIARGIIFRLWARVWGVIVAALISSALFALVHFIQPDANAFRVSNFWSAVSALSLSALRPDMSDPAFFIRLLNLACLGLALCAMVRLTGTIWLAVGAHAGWVWCIKANNYFTDAVPLPLRTHLWGARGDLTDSVMGTVMLIAVLLIILWLQKRRTQRG